MKRIIVFILLSFLSNKIYSLNTEIQNQVSSIEILYIDWEIETPFSVDCNIFDKIWADKIKRILIQDKATLKKIKNELSILKQEERYKNQVDTRVKIVIYNVNNEIEEEYCIDRFFVFDGVNLLKLSPSFMSLLIELGVV